MIQAEKTKCKKRAKPSWTTKISVLSEEIKYWSVATRGFRNNINVSEILSNILKEVSEELKLTSANKITIDKAQETIPENRNNSLMMVI